MHFSSIFQQCIGSACSSTTENLGVLPWAATFWLMVAAVVLLGVGSLTAAAAYYDWIMTRPARVLVFLAGMPIAVSFSSLPSWRNNKTKQKTKNLFVELCVTLSVLLYPIGFSTYFSGGTYATTGAAAYQLPSAWALGYSFYLAAASLAVLLLAEIARVALRERSENDVIDALLFD